MLGKGEKGQAPALHGSPYITMLQACIVLEPGTSMKQYNSGVSSPRVVKPVAYQLSPPPMRRLPTASCVSNLNQLHAPRPANVNEEARVVVTLDHRDLSTWLQLTKLLFGHRVVRCCQ